MMFAVSCLVYFLFFMLSPKCVNALSNGALVLSRYGYASSSYYYGTVRVYYNNGWGNICYDSSYGNSEANVICHQLGYTGASTYSRAGLVSYGTDILSMKMDDLNCASYSYLTIFQCSFSTSIDSGCTNTNSYDATVYCYSTRIWNSNPYPGMIRLQGGNYPNEGRVEVYCNGQWGTICDNGFGSTDAQTICKQLGYNYYYRYDYISLSGNSSQPIWNTYMSSSSSDTCYGTRNSCPSASITSCYHYEDVTVECTYSSSYSKTYNTETTCSGLISLSNGALVLSRYGYASSSYYYGTVRVYYNNGWGNICYDSSYGYSEANVICHQLGYTGASTYSRAGSVSYGTDTLSMKMDDLNCVSSSYLTIFQCSFSTYIDSGCTNTNSYDATVYCYFTRIWNSNPYSGMIRLQGGNYSNEGRVEIYCNGQWGTICDNGFSSTDAQTICKQMGYNYYYRYDHLNLSGSYYQPIWSTYMSSYSYDTCYGTRNSCPSTSLSGCSHSEDVTVTCTYSSSYSTSTATQTTCSGLIDDVAKNGAIVLSHYGYTSSSYYYGTVRVYYNNGWGNICYDSSYGYSEANVICHQLGYTGAATYSRAGLVSYGTDTLSMKMDDLNCYNSSYLTIFQCSFSTYIDSGCTNTNSYDATVYCYSTRIWNSNPYPGMIRLQGGNYSNEGRVEVYCNGQWGTICDNGFSSTDAQTICKQLGYNYYYRYDHLSLSGSYYQPIWNTYMSSYYYDTCYGSRNSCPSSSMTNCSHSEDVTVTCTYSSSYSKSTATQTTCSGLIATSDAIGNGVVRLYLNGYTSSSNYYGIVQILYNGQWGNICDDTYYNQYEADVICHQLGYTGASNYSRAGYVSYGTDYNLMILNRVNCSNNNYLTILQCSYSTYIYSGCNSNSYDATVICYTSRIWNSNPYPGMIRLQGGNYSNEGRVEIYCNGQWGTICDDGFDSTDANTICKQLGYTGYIRYDHLTLPGSYSQPIWSTFMSSSSSDSCFGTSNSCPSSRVTSCSHSEDVTISCTYSSNSSNYITRQYCSSLSSSSSVVGPVVGGTLSGIFILIIIIVAISSVICWYKGIGICAKLRKRRRPRTTDRDQDNELELNTLVRNPRNNNTIQSTSTSHQNTLPSTTVNTMPHYTGNTLPNVVPQATPNPYVQYSTLPAQGGHSPSPYYYVPPTNVAFKNRQPATHIPPPYSQVSYLPRQQMYPSTYMIPVGTLPQQYPQQYMTPQQNLYVQQPQQMGLQSNVSTNTQNVDSPVPQESVTIRNTPTQNSQPHGESSTPVTGNSNTPVSRENDTSVTSINAVSPTPQVPAVTISPTTTTANNSANEAQGAVAITEDMYEVVGGLVANNNVAYEVVNSDRNPPSYSDLYDDTA